MSLLIPSKQKLDQIISKIPETQILAGVLSNGFERNNLLLLTPPITAVAYINDKDLSISKSIQIKSVRFLNNKNRDFLICELTPDIKSIITSELGQPPQRVSGSKYLYDLILPKFTNWYFAPIHKELTSQLAYFSDEIYPLSFPVIISDNVGPSDFMSQYLSEYLEIGSDARITNVWVLADETILISFTDQGQELLFYYRRY